MNLLAAHLNDAGLLFTDGERILCREPGYALLEEDDLITGREAWASASMKPRRIQNHYWDDLSTKSLTDVRFTHLTAADLVSRQLESLWKRVAKPGDKLALAVPGYMSNDNLGLLLGIAVDLDIPVVSMVDAAVAATRRQYVNAVPVHIDLSLKAAMLTRLSQDGQAQYERAAVVDDTGMLDLYAIWLRMIAETFVQQSRFDPLHTAETEQVLQDRMLDWLAIASSQESVTMDIEYRGIAHQAEIASLEFVAAATPVYQNIVSNLRALYRAGEIPALQLSDRAARMPGLADTLKARVGGEVFLLEPGATARGLVARCSEQRLAGGVTLARHLPWDQASVAVEVAGGGGSAQPTHILFDNNALAVNADALLLGTAPAEGERWLDLGQDMPGVSRRHCDITTANGQCVVTDHSRYGTFLNGHRIDGSAALQTGDVIRVGTPGVELRLIFVE
ncbi:MAG: FHA domain-containing protein [Gammaproteobacteria bacterium]|nr:FHA domain-containing protein [Gammaproteobacteria bacterium]